ncbi:MAG: hypothetical protein QGH60_10310 [Phycisphaerae bacterium]|jgi:organic hydroperoxide reductase OsmC/OhrA|nr:hypothetical protein [Phycisphaerae bacterium]
MNPKDQLPTELGELEASLANRNRVKSDDDLRRDVLDGVRAELHAPRKSNNWWSFAAAVAACFLLAMNLAIASVNVSDYPRNTNVKTADVEETTRLVQDLLPELSREQARQHSMMLSGARLSPLP